MRKLKNEELERKTVEDFKESTKNPIIIVLDNVRSMNNIGSIFRTSDAFLVEKLYLCGITAVPPHREIQKTALGATESVDWKYFESITEAIYQLKESGYKIVAVEQTTESIFLDLFAPLKGEKFALIFGNEIDGVSDEAINSCDYSLEIPQFGSKHSFNISVSVGIVLWDLIYKIHKN